MRWLLILLAFLIIGCGEKKKLTNNVVEYDDTNFFEVQTDDENVSLIETEITGLVGFAVTGLGDNKEVLTVSGYDQKSLSGKYQIEFITPDGKSYIWHWQEGMNPYEINIKPDYKPKKGESCLDH